MREVESVKGSHTRAANTDSGTKGRTPWGDTIGIRVKQAERSVTGVVLAAGTAQKKPCRYRDVTGQLKMMCYTKMWGMRKE